METQRAIARELGIDLMWKFWESQEKILMPVNHGVMKQKRGVV